MRRKANNKRPIYGWNPYRWIYSAAYKDGGIRNYLWETGVTEITFEYIDDNRWGDAGILNLN